MAGRYGMNTSNRYSIETERGRKIVKDLREYKVAEVKPGGTISVDLFDANGEVVTKQFVIFSIRYTFDEAPVIVVEDK